MPQVQQHVSITEQQAKSLARRGRLDAADVSGLMNIQIGEYADFEFTETEIRRVKVKQSDYRLLFPDEKAEILSAGKRLHLALPCTPRSLVAWAERNHYLDCLPASFLEVLGKRSRSRRKRGRPPVSEEVKERIKLAATRFLQGVPRDQLGKWRPREIACHGNFIQRMWPDNKRRLSASSSARSYKEAYGLGLRTIEDIIRSVKTDFLTATRVQKNI